MSANDDEELFKQAMQGVSKLPDDKRVHRKPPVKSEKLSPAKPQNRFVVTQNGDEFRGRAPGVSAQQLAPFVRGDISPDERVDLHGCTRERAKELILRRVEAAAKRQLRCVVVIHGKGTHSEDGIPVLRATCVSTLSSDRLSAYVYGFCTAPKRWGGTGAMLVALRSSKKA